MRRFQNLGRTVRRIFRHTARIAGIVLLVGVVIFAVGATAVWSNYWDFHVGNPPSETCGTCHVMQTYVDSLTTPHLLASAHATAGIACTDCHQYDAQRQLDETIAYLTNNYDEPFPRARYPMDTCFQCHEHGSYPQIAWRTTDLGVTDAQTGSHEANPHQPPHYTNLECNSCHRVHRESTLLCAECHVFRFESRFFSPQLQSEDQGN